MIRIIFIFLFVIATAYYMTKLIAKKGDVFARNKNIKIIEKMSFGMDKAIYILRIGESYYIVSVGKNNIELLDKMSKEDLHFEPKDEYNKNEPFHMYLDKHLQIKDEVEFFQENMGNSDEFATSIMKKLKRMKSRDEGTKYSMNKDEKDE